jgi:predicted Zn finger-like uncharacterized protein
MDVRCDRCDTEYDFDDALVSERGTTVRCTNCGHQFKVYPAQRAPAGTEYWVVRTGDGQVFTFTTLRDLQSGLAAGRIGPDDELERGAGPARPLRAIAELEPFFPSKRPTGGKTPHTLSGVAPPTVKPSTSEPPDSHPSPFKRSPSARPPSAARAARRPERDTDRPPTRSDAAPEASDDARERLGRTLPSKTSEPPTVRRPKGVSSKLGAARLAKSPAPSASGRGKSDAPAPNKSEPRRAVTAPFGATLRSEITLEQARSPTGPSAFDRARALAPVASTPPPSEPPEQASDSVDTPRRPPPLDAFGSELDSSPAASPMVPEPPPAAASEPTQARLVPPVAPAPAPVEPELPEPPPSNPVAVPEPSEQFFTESMRAVLTGDRPSDPDSRFLVGASRRAARSRWIIGLVLSGALALMGIAIGRRWLGRTAAPPSEPTTGSSSGAHVRDLVRVGLGLLEQGDLDGARENLAQARALGNRDASTLIALVRLEDVSAELVWLRLRLLDPADQESRPLTERQLATTVERAGKMVDAATEVAPENPDVVRAKVDLLRLRGDLGKARELVGPLAAKPSDPANAYALGALDLAEPAPIWTSVIDRLRAAARADQGLGLARAALIYALGRAGQLEEARAELASLGRNARPHVLLGELRAFLRRVGETDAGEVDAEAPSVDTETPAALDKTAATEHPAGAADYRDQLVRARSALARGRLDEADGLYRAVLAKDSSNTEALTGLADVARARNDPRSGELYDQALAKNPSYLPALMARADQRWSSGDRGGAAALYRQILEQAGPSSEYGQRAAARLAQSSAPQSSAPSKPPGSASRPTSPAPEIDTTDLSGLK